MARGSGFGIQFPRLLWWMPKLASSEVLPIIVTLEEAPRDGVTPMGDTDGGEVLPRVARTAVTKAARDSSRFQEAARCFVAPPTPESEHFSGALHPMRSRCCLARKSAAD